MIPQPRRPSRPWPDGDPRGRTDGLGWVTRAVFPSPALRLSMTGGDGARFAVLPSADRARFLLPLVSRRVTAASVLAYNALRPLPVRSSRVAVGALARAGLLGVLRAPVLTISGGPLLSDHLATLLGEPVLHAAIGVRPPDPHHKPTLQLFDDNGKPCAYAKIGWNPGTRAMVSTEIATLTAGPPPFAPRLIGHTHWHDREIALIEPMPRGSRRTRGPHLPAMCEIAGAGGPVPFGTSTFLAAWRRRASGAALAAAGTPDPGRITVDAAIDALVTRDGDLTVAFGRWHGDWVPWNMARHRGRLIVWDWENSASDVPLGFDLAHHAFHLGHTVDAVDRALSRHGPALGLDRRRQLFVADAYLIELWLRAFSLADGAGWNPRLHPALLDILAARFAL